MAIENVGPWTVLLVILFVLMGLQQWILAGIYIVFLIILAFLVIARG